MEDIEPKSSGDRGGSRFQSSGACRYTPTQGRYLAFIHRYMEARGISPAESDIATHFMTSAPTAHQMIVTLERKGLISRTPGVARSIRLLISADEIPDVRTGKARSDSDSHSHIAAWLGTKDCTIGLGYDPKTRTFARAFRGDSLVWGGGRKSDSLESLLGALNAAIASAAEAAP